MELISSTNNISVNNQILEKVSNFNYLGSRMFVDGDSMKEINTHIAVAASTFTKLNNIWKSKDLGRNTKLKPFNSCIVPVLTYGSENWKSTQATDQKLNSFENKCLRKLMNIKWSDFVTNSDLRNKTHQEYVSNIIRKRRWKYLGHVFKTR